jgi:DNA-nicking Smr family endonuclease
MKSKSGKDGRPLQMGEDDLWRAATRNVTPRAGRPVSPALGPEEGSPFLKRLLKERQAEQSGLGGPGPLIPNKQTGRLHGLDKRTVRKVSRGRIPVERTLDLHGFHQDQARQKLRWFLAYAQKEGCRCVLVITGKGGIAGQYADGRSIQPVFDPAPRGVLRAMLPQWLAEAPLREMVANLEPAHDRHGGHGAFYVFIKRIKRR